VARERLASLAEGLLETPGSGGPALLSGLPGIALAHAALAGEDGGGAHAERARAHLETAVAASGGLRGDGGLARGIAGLAFALELLEGDGGGEGEGDGDGDGDGDPNRAIDEALADEVASDREIPAELMRGLAGRAVYARQRLSRASGTALHDAIVERLVAMAEPQPGGVAWRSAPDPRHADRALCARYPDGWFDLGVAHGAPAVIAALAGGGERAADTARAGMSWMWHQRRTGGGPAFAALAGEAPHEEPGWCYGDEGIGAVLFLAARTLGDQAWEARWLEVLEAAAARRAPTLSLALCHGAAGLAHIDNSVYQATGASWARDAAIDRLDQLLDRLPGELDRLPPGLLDGQAGIALALIAALGADEPAWDRALALSIARPG